jgi:alpha-glucosidase
MLSLYWQLINLRKQEPALSEGRYTPIYADHQMIAYTRMQEGHDAFLIILNLTHRPCYFRPEHFPFRGTVEIATIPELEGTVVSNNISLDGDEGVIIRLSAEQ